MMQAIVPVSSQGGAISIAGLEPMPNPIVENEDEKSKLAYWQREIAQDGIKVALNQPTGAVAGEILNQADAISADLIVMGIHGHSAMCDLLVGRATKGVLKHSSRPLLLIPRPKSS